MAKCDICGTNSSLYEMADLRDIYQTASIRSMCRSCETWANAELWKIRAENDKTFKARLCERAGCKQRVGWFRRLFSTARGGTAMSMKKSTVVWMAFILTDLAAFAAASSAVPRRWFYLIPGGGFVRLYIATHPVTPHPTPAASGGKAAG